jgi:hypothetical protein
VQLSPDKTKWVANVFSDIVLVLIFLIYCGRVHVQSVSTSTVITACDRLCCVSVCVRFDLSVHDLTCLYYV